MKHQRIVMHGVILLTLGLLALPVGQASAETVLEKISRTGQLTAGTRTSSIPLAYINEKNEWVGLSIDLLKAIQQRLQRNMAKPIKLELKEVTPKTRIPLVANRTIDIECGSTTYTRDRDETVDFSINFFYTGSQLLVKLDSPIRGIQDLAGKRVGATQGTTNEKILRARQPLAKLVVFQDHSQGFLALQQGKIDAYSTDGILLAGLAAKSPTPDAFKVVGTFFSKEPYSCILPQHDSTWRDFVNHTFMEVIESGTYFELYEKWFGENGVVNYPMPTPIKAFMLLQVMPR
ncbi:MAG: amino acid ABC transporter substrate-binding protein [Candidatus Methylomirabilales bacterium]